MRGYYGIGIYHPKHGANVGSLWRSAHILGASFLFTVGHRYRYEITDTTQATKSIPLYHYDTLDSMIDHLPFACPLIGIELHERAHKIQTFVHPDRAVYLLGSEDSGLPPNVVNRCHTLVQLPGQFCFNVATAGSLVLFHRWQQFDELESVRGQGGLP